VITNTKFWMGLPPDIRAQLDKAMTEASEYTNSIAKQENADSLAKIKASGKTTLHYLTPAQVSAWKAAFKPVYKEAEGRVGKQIVDELLTAAGIKI
ncbi:MAG: C4-dicarboxylate ABC transporter, partial [Burkholderiales bacterium]|nr:C4-dicarboxylate ABC transporter [Burkholderiales bacterium]